MIRPFLLASAGLAAALAVTAAHAQEGASGDLRCLAVAMTLAGNADPKAQGAGVSAGLYYLGKLDGRDPALDLEARLKQEIVRMTPQSLRADAQRCGTQLGVRGKALTEIGARLKALAAAGKAP